MRAEEAAATMRLDSQLVYVDFELFPLAKSLQKLVISNANVCFQLRRRKQFEDHQDYLKRKTRQMHQNRKMYVQLSFSSHRHLSSHLLWEPRIKVLCKSAQQCGLCLSLACCHAAFCHGICT